VVRASKYPAFRSEPFASPQKLYAQGGLPLLEEDAREKSAFLLDLGINVNLAPVADVSTDPSSFIYYRTLGQDAETTARYVESTVQTMRNAGIGCALKHFPGYGNNGDTHQSIITDTRDAAAFWQADFLPFQSGIAAGADMVLVSHTIVQAFDAERPASISPAIYTLLREELGFTGLIITDDMGMDGLTAFTDDGDAAVQAVLAGADILLTSRYPAQIAAVLQAVEDGRIPMQTIDERVTRILRYKIEKGLFD